MLTSRSSPHPARPPGRRTHCHSTRPHRGGRPGPASRQACRLGWATGHDRVSSRRLGRAVRATPIVITTVSPAPASASVPDMLNHGHVLCSCSVTGNTVQDALLAAAAAGHGLSPARRDRAVSPRRCYPAGGGCWPVGRSLPAVRSATNTFCSMCQSCGCVAIPSSSTLASCWVMAAIFCGRVPVLGTGISW